MNKTKYIITAFLLLATLSLVIPTQSLAKPKKKKAPKLNYTKITLHVGGTIKLKVKNAKKTVTWKSSDTSIARVQKGKVTADATGTVVITAKTAGKKLRCKVKIVATLYPDDFAAAFTAEDGTSYTSALNYLRASKNDSDYLSADPGDKTNRGISIGAKKSKVMAVYGYEKEHTISFAEAALSSLDLSNSSYYLDYVYTIGKTPYQIRFYFDDKDKVTIILLAKNI